VRELINDRDMINVGVTINNEVDNRLILSKLNNE